MLKITQQKFRLFLVLSGNTVSIILFLVTCHHKPPLSEEDKSLVKQYKSLHQSYQIFYKEAVKKHPKEIKELFPAPATLTKSGVPSQAELHVLYMFSNDLLFVLPEFDIIHHDYPEPLPPPPPSSLEDVSEDTVIVVDALTQRRNDSIHKIEMAEIEKLIKQDKARLRSQFLERVQKLKEKRQQLAPGNRQV